ncbi:hypothetical protein M3J09_010192 [Ascochyta lentis]
MVSFAMILSNSPPVFAWRTLVSTRTTFIRICSYSLRMSYCSPNSKAWSVIIVYELILGYRTGLYPPVALQNSVDTQHKYFSHVILWSGLERRR